MKFLACDIETTGLDYKSDKILCIGFSDGSYYTNTHESIPRFSQTKQDREILVFHNGSFDTKFLWENGVKVENTFDTMIAAYLLKERPNKLSLDSLVSFYLGMPSWKEDIKSGAVFEDPALMKEYCLQDCRYTVELAKVLHQKLKDEGRDDFFWRLMKVRRTLTLAEYRGITLNVEDTKALEQALKCDAKILNDKIQEQAREHTNVWCEQNGKKSFNLMSPKQVLWLLKHLGLDTINPVTRKESADITVLTLNKGKHPIIDGLIELRKLKKQARSLEGYCKDVKGDGRIHCNLNCSNVRTGRLSSSGPNMQQVDRSERVRALFTARPGMSLVVGDLAQIEVRMAAHYSKDPTLIKMFQNEEDFYGTLAVEVLGSQFHPNEVKTKDPVKRQVAKVIGLSILYGVGVNKLRTFIKEKGGVEYSHTEIRMLINKYFDRFSGLKRLQMGVHRRCQASGYITNLWGRKVDVAEKDIYMKGVNTLLQSSASDLLLFRACQVDEMVDWANFLLPVHDEIIFEVPEGREQEFINIIKPIMEETDSIGFRVPLKMDLAFGPNWSCKM